MTKTSLCPGEIRWKETDDDEDEDVPGEGVAQPSIEFRHGRKLCYVSDSGI